MAPVPRFEGLWPRSAESSRAKRLTPRVNTKPEILLRRALAKAGFRGETHPVRLVGKPDLAFSTQRLAVFVDGDFWHGRQWKARRAKLERGHNSRYWIEKIQANMLRDRRKRRQLKNLGWKVVRMWETDILRDPTAAAAYVTHALLAPPDRDEKP